MAGCNDAELKRLAEAVEAAREADSRSGHRMAGRATLRAALLEALQRFDNAANPATILRLLRERDEARAAVKRVRKVAEGANDNGLPYTSTLPPEVGALADAVIDALDADQGEGEGA